MFSTKFKPLLDHILKVNLNDTRNGTSNNYYSSTSLKGFFEMVHFIMFKKVESKDISNVDYQFYVNTFKPHLIYLTNIQTNRDLQFFMDRASEIDSYCRPPMINYLVHCLDILMNLNYIPQNGDYPELLKFRWFK
jgi:hypothetical protein